MSNHGSPVSPWDNDDILRAELFSTEPARAACRESRGRPTGDAAALGAPLPQRAMKDNESVLLAAYRVIGQRSAKAARSPGRRMAS